MIFTPDPRLRNISDRVDESEFGPELEEHMNNMLNKMRELNGVGLAGIQVGDQRRILVADPGTGPIRMVNPEFVERSEETVMFQEGCLSLPGFVTDVERSETIKIKYNTPLGEEKEEDFFGVEAVAVQHEMEHLDGITILDKVSRLKKDMYNRKIRKIKRRIKKRIEKMSQVYY
tara:strand:+ start:632 stop:1153 length:522 start_codon:yes stop_codon:yes gene_type:complete